MGIASVIFVATELVGTEKVQAIVEVETEVTCTGIVVSLTGKKMLSYFD